MMRRKKYVSKFSMCLASVMAFTTLLAGCGKSESTKTSTDGTRDYDHVYKQEEFDLGDVDTTDYYSLGYSCGYYILSGTQYNEDTNSYTAFVFNKDKENEYAYNIEFVSGETSEYINETTVDGEGNLYALVNKTSYDDTGAIQSDDYFIRKYDTSGEQLFESQINDSDDSENSVYFSTIHFATGKGVVVSSDESVRLYNSEDGSLLGRVDTTDYISGDIVLDDGRVILMTSGENQTGYSYVEVDFDSKKLGSDLAFPSDIDNLYSRKAGINYDIIANSDDGIYGYNIGDDSITLICSYIDSDIEPDSYNDFVEYSETELLAIGYSDDEGRYVLNKFTKVPADEVADQIQLTLGCYDMDYDVRKQVIAFNKKGGKYRISIVDYAKYDDNYDGTGLTKLNTDIISGNTPDILLINSSMPFESYVSKGVLQELDTYLAGMSSYNSDNYLVNINDSYKISDKTYCITPYFDIFTNAAKTSEVGDKTGWTINDIMDYADAKGVNYSDIFGYKTRDEIFQDALYANSDLYIDWDNHTCNFDDGNFATMLEFVKNFPKELDESSYITDTSAWWREGKALCYMQQIYSYDSYKYTLKGTFGEDITYIGFPGDETSGSAIISNVRLGIGASSKYKDGAWEFIESLMTEEYQDSIDYDFPILKSSLAKRAEESMQRQYYLDENNEKVEYDDTTSIGSEEVTITPLTKDEADYLTTFIESLNKHVDYNTEIYNIITEEASGYFENQKTVEEVCDIIQSRVTIYVNENG